MHELTLLLDDDDYRALQEAMALRQSLWRWPDGSCMLPDGDSDLEGALVAEICRGWVEMVGRDAHH